MSTNHLVSDRPGKPYKGIAMEGVIARWYAKNGGRVSEQIVIVKKIKEALPTGGDVLEVAPGPGYLAIELASSHIYKVTGLEISKTFIEIAQANARQANVTVDFRHGNASEMPLEDNTFDFIVFFNLYSTTFLAWFRKQGTSLKQDFRTIFQVFSILIIRY